MATAPPTGTRTPMGTVGDVSIIIVGGLVISWLAGFIGSIAFDSGEDGQATLYVVSNIAAAIAAGLLVVRHIRSGLILSGAGFAILLTLVGASSVVGYSGAGPEAVLANLAILFLPGLVLIAAQDWSPVWARAAAALAGLLFAIYGFDYVLGQEAADPDSPWLIAAYLAWAVAIAGWALTVREEGDAVTTARTDGF